MTAKKRDILRWFGATALTAGITASIPYVSAHASNKTIALVPGMTTDPFYITMERGAQAEAKKLGLHLIWQGGTSFSPESQTPVLQALLAKHPAALLVAPTSEVALTNPIRQFVAAGIPVISVDTTIKDKSLLKSRISSNNVQGGEAAAKAIAKFAHHKGDVAVINFSPGVSTAMERQKGFLDQMKRYKHMKVVSIQFDDDSPTKAFTETQLLLLKYPHLVGIFGTNLYSAKGAGKATVASGKKGKVDIVGYDAEPEEVKLLKKRIITTLIVQRPAAEGKLAVKYAYDLITGHASSVKKKVLLDNVVATTENASEPNISKYYYKTSISKRQP